MSQKNIDFGNYPDDPDADAIRTAFQKVQDNFTQLFAPVGAESAVTSVNRTPGAGITVNAPTGNVVISANIACVQVHTSTLSIGRGTNGFQDTSITSSSQVLWVDLPETIENVGNIILTNNANIGGNAIIGGNANITGNLTSGNANLGNAATANFFLGDGGLLSNIAGGGPSNELTISAPVTNYQVNLLGGNVYIDPYTDFYLYCSGVTADAGGNIFLYGVNEGDFIAPLLAKYNSAGTLQWQKYFDETSVTVDPTGMIACDSSGNIYMVYFDFDIEALNLVKVNTSGTLVWQRQIGSIISPNTYNITVDSSNNVFLVFDDANDLYSVKYNSSGTLQWENVLNTAGSWPLGIYSDGVCTDSSGNLYFVGSNEFEYSNSLLVKYNSAGTLQYANQIDDFAIHGVTVDSSSNIYLVGRRFNGTFIQSLVVKLDSSGTQLWTSYFNRNGGAGETTFAAIACELFGSTLYVFGTDDATGWSYKGYVVSMSTTTGDVNWQNSISQPLNNFDKPYPLFNDYASKNLSGIMSVNSNGLLLAATYEPTAISGIADLAFFNLPTDGTGLGVYDYFSYSPTVFDYTLSGITLVIASSGITSSTSSLTTGNETVAVTTPTYLTFQEFLFPSGTRTFTLNANSILTFPDGTLQYSAFNPYLANLPLGTPIVNSLTTTGSSVRIGPIDTLIGEGSIGIGSSINSAGTLNSIAIGNSALNQVSSNANFSVAIGTSAGYSQANANIVAIGHRAAEISAGQYSVSIGAFAGRTGMANNSISIGAFAGNAGITGANTIIINATGTDLNPTVTDAFYIKPIRNIDSGNLLYYDSTSGEVSYSTGVSLGQDLTWTGAQRGSITTDNDLSFDMDVTNNFSCTPAAGGTLTFTNITAGQSGFVLLDNSGGYSISAAATTKVGSGFLAAVSVAGVYLLSYFSDGTNVYVVNSGALT